MLTTIGGEDAHAKRWREWQLKNEHEEQKRARRAGVMFTAIFVAVAIWIGYQALNA